MDYLSEVGKKGVIITLLLMYILTSCCYLCSPSVWDVSSDKSFCPNMHFARLSHKICNPFRDISFEILKTDNTWQAFLTVQSMPLIPPCSTSPRFMRISLQIQECEITFDGEVYEGGQKIALPDPIAMEMIAALCSNREVVLQIGRYCSKIPCEGFQTAYSKFGAVR